MSSPTYSELLKHPEWQKKRLEILQRYGFSCEVCCSSEKTLHIHHIQYLKGRKPWEYDNDNFMCLCEECHQIQGEYQSECLKYVSLIFRNMEEQDREWFQQTLRTFSGMFLSKKLLLEKEIEECFAKRAQEEKL